MRVAAWALFLCVVLGLSACSSPNPPSATAAASSANSAVQRFCKIVAEHKDRYERAMSAAQSTNELANLVVVASALGDLKTMWSDLADAAPPEIKTDVEATKDAWASAESAASQRDVLAALNNALLNSAAVSRVSKYIAANCGAEYAPTGVGGAAAPTVTTGILLDDSWTTSDGYSYRVVLYRPVAPQTTLDVANAAPGRADLSFVLKVSGTIFNLTAGHNAPVPDGLRVAAGWARPNIVCDALDASMADNAELNDSYCGRTFDVAAASSSIPVGGSVDFQGAVGTIFPLVLAESAGSATEAAVKSPNAWAVLSGGGGISPSVDSCISTAHAC